MKNITDIVRAGITALTLIFGFVYFFLAAFIYEVRDPQITICVVSLMTGVFGYWLGSSLGSSKKQDQLDALNKNSVADAPPEPTIDGSRPGGR